MVTVIKFEADWCQPCKVFAPVFKKVAASYDNDSSVEFRVVNIDEDPDTATKFSVRSIPTVIITDGEEVLETVVGALNAEQLKSVVERNR